MKTNRKKNILLSLGCMFCFSVLWSQSPAGISYQAIIRDAGMKLLTNQMIGLQVSILQGDHKGGAVFREVHIASTNAGGLLTVEIGSGTVLNGDLSSINWGDGPYYIKTEIDPGGGTNYSIAAESQLLTVPYALYAQTAQSLSGELTEKEPVFYAWDRSTGVLINESQIRDLKNYVETESDPVYSSSPARGITQDDISNWNNKPNSYDEADPVFAAWDKSTGITITESKISNLGNYLETEDDPVYLASAAAGITGDDISNWNNKLGSFAETDPVFGAWNKSSGIRITENQISDLGNYVVTESDPVFNSSAAFGITASHIDNWNNKLDSYTETQDLNSVLSNNNSADSKNISNLSDPVNAQDIATKACVDEFLERIEFLELLSAGFTDPRDGNHYNVVQIGDQVWMAENLRYLPVVSGPGKTSYSMHCYYVYGYGGTNVEEARATPNYATYGVLYNWTAATNRGNSSTANPSGVQGICPDGWHLPSDAEWTELTNHLGGTGFGGWLKEAGYAHWSSPNLEATNQTRFSALPGGLRYDDYNFHYMGTYGYWWTSTEDINNPGTNAWYRGMNNVSGGVFFGWNKKEYGFSVRCVKD